MLVSSTVFDTAGNPVTQTAPDSVTTASTFDAADRRTVLVENSTGASGTTRTTRFQYTPAGALAKLLSDNPDTGTQTTEWVYGVTTGQGSALNSNRLLREKIYPGGGADRVTYTYNRQGQPLTMTDQNGTVHAYTYDKLGVRIADTVTTFGTGVDSTVGRLEAGYNERRLQVRATSANASGSVVLNEVAWGYNDFNQPVTEWQEHGGRVNTGSPKVQYTYADGSANTIRPTGITYPDGTTTIATDYSSAQASALSRPDRISGSGGVIASWQYLGLGAVVRPQVRRRVGCRVHPRHGRRRLSRHRPLRASGGNPLAEWHQRSGPHPVRAQPRRGRRLAAQHARPRPHPGRRHRGQLLLV